MCYIETIAIITHGNLMALASANTYQIVVAVNVAIVHDNAVAATPPDNIQIRKSNLASC
jgi:hypothetical protein